MFSSEILDPRLFQRHGKILGMDHKASSCLIIIYLHSLLGGVPKLALRVSMS